jgi:TRAP-type C4-dicarboxylate transport system permease small subunit
MLSSLLTTPATLARKACESLAMLATAYLLFVVAFNIAARAVFDLTGGSINFLINGAIEQAAYALLILVFASLPAALHSGLVSVDVLTTKLPDGIQSLAKRVWFLVFFGFALLLLWLFAHETATSFVRGDSSQDLGIPLYVFFTVITVECAALALVSLREALSPTPAESV